MNTKPKRNLIWETHFIKEKWEKCVFSQIWQKTIHTFFKNKNKIFYQDHDNVSGQNDEAIMNQ